jgi:AcrR family transcriptional regulator
VPPHPQKKWTRRAGARPEELARAALELCAERGVQATRVADVAAKAGVTVGTVYRYYAGKDALVQAALALSGTPAVSRTLPERPGAVLPALADAIRRWGTHFASVGSQALRVSLSDPRLGASNPRSAIESAESELADLLAIGVERGEVRADVDATAFARALVGALVLGPALAGARAEPDTASATMDAVAAVATRGLRRDGPSWRPTGA